MMCACQDAKIENKYSLSGMSFHDKKVLFFSPAVRKQTKRQTLNTSCEKNFAWNVHDARSFHAFSLQFQLFTNQNSKFYTTYVRWSCMRSEKTRKFIFRIFLQLIACCSNFVKVILKCSILEIFTSIAFSNWKTSKCLITIWYFIRVHRITA